MDDKAVGQAMQVIRQAMRDDNPSEAGSLAHSWHCNIAIECYVSMRDGLEDDTVSHEVALMIANEAASRFMKQCFGVETRGESDGNTN